MGRSRPAMLAALFLVALSACGRKDLVFDPPGIDPAESALVALIFDDSIEVYGHDARSPLMLGRKIGDRSVHLEAAILTAPLMELGLNAGPITAKMPPADSVSSLDPIHFFSASVGDSVSPWEPVSSLDPRFSGFPIVQPPSDCLALSPQELVIVPVDDPTFAEIVDVGSLLIGLKNGDVFRVTPTAFFHVEHPSLPSVERILSDPKGGYWVGGSEGDLWHATLMNDHLDATLVATASTAGALRWLAADKDNVVGLSTDGYVVEFTGANATILGRLPPSGDPTLSFWGGITYLPDGSILVVQGTVQRAVVFDHGMRSEEPLPIEGTGFGNLMWGGTVLARDNLMNRTLSGSTGQVLIRDDATKTWSATVYDGETSDYTGAMLEYGGTFFAADSGSRIWQYSAAGKRFCMERVVGEYDPVALLVQGKSLVVVSGGGSTAMGTTRVQWLDLGGS